MKAYTRKKEFGLARLTVKEFPDEFEKSFAFSEIALAEGAGSEFQRRTLDIINRFGDSSIFKKDVYFLKSIYLAYIDKIEDSISMLENQYKNHNSWVLEMRHNDLLEEKLGSHPRYISLYKKLGLTGKPAAKSR